MKMARAIVHADDSSRLLTALSNAGQRLREDEQLRDPLMVGALRDVDGLVLLDGTNRRRALDNLGFSLAMVQVIDYADHNSVQLRTWCHGVTLPQDGILDEARAIPGV